MVLAGRDEGRGGAPGGGVALRPGGVQNGVRRLIEARGPAGDGQLAVGGRGQQQDGHLPTEEQTSWQKSSRVRNKQWTMDSRRISCRFCLGFWEAVRGRLNDQLSIGTGPVAYISTAAVTLTNDNCFGGNTYLRAGRSHSFFVQFRTFAYFYGDWCGFRFAPWPH